MMIMVIQGLDCPERDAVLTQLGHLVQPKMVTIDVSFLPDIDRRVERLATLLSRSWSVLNVVLGANSKEEIDFLRARQAMFFNLHRRFPSVLLKIEGAILSTDRLISPDEVNENDVPVLSPAEAFSECFIHHKTRSRQGNKELSHGH
ncbi:hypothetical protein [Vibrio vulnificus]|uniref:hypothetical protein n=1 Tax=Vibrio vulnificus TaxID=672 RepID=UPI0024DF9370|nr:hypothetical protein [Vibrio vulnificus]MDK2679248.1 hypothetical protein [Vibrio vulnificus]MDK2688023.1 hypothetical protein [Vibrio vulnificus]